MKLNSTLVMMVWAILQGDFVCANDAQQLPTHYKNETPAQKATTHVRLSEPNKLEAKVYELTVPPTEGGNEFYISNRPPLLPSPLIKLPSGSIAPHGWLRHQLLLMSDGMIGHISEVSPWVGPKSGWRVPENDGDERVPYWLKGYISLGYSLGDKRIIRESQEWIDAVMAGQAEDGYFGPQVNRDRHLWPNMPMLFVMQTYYEASGDKRVLDFMGNYFRYQNSIPHNQFLGGSWMKIRGGDNLESVYWLYNRTAERWLLEFARHVYEQTADWTGGTADNPRWKENMPASYPLPSDHGVNITMGYRQPGVFYQQSGDSKHLAAVEKIYSLVMSEFGHMPGGMFGADERMQPGMIDPRQAAETCSVVEFMYSHESMLKITGDPKYADRCENIAFNTYPATMTPDMKALRYLTAPNMPQCDAAAKSCFRNNEKAMVSFSAGTEYHCCQHNHGQGWPYYTEHLWMATHNNGLAAIFYSPSTVEATVGNGTRIKITEKTDYPFGETVDLTISTPHAVQFPLLLRIPRWCRTATVRINGKLQSHVPSPASYVVIERTWKDGDDVSLELPMEISLSVWDKNKNSVSVNRGPLTYSLRIGEKWVFSDRSDPWPKSEVFPTTPWNYGLIVNHDNPADSFTILKKTASAEQPFTPKNAPVELRAQGRRIPNWRLTNTCIDELPQSPVHSSEPLEELTLIPMGCARLRISVFPVVEEGR